MNRDRRCIRVLATVLATLLVAVLGTASQAQADSGALSLSAGPVTLPPLVPGVSADDTGSVAVIASTPSDLSTDATLTVVDASGYGTPGHLDNAGFSLASPIEAIATSTAPGATAGSLGAISDVPLTLLTYSQPVSDDPVTVTFSQHIDATDALRTGTYAKPLTFTLTAGV